MCCAMTQPCKKSYYGIMLWKSSFQMCSLVSTVPSSGYKPGLTDVCVIPHPCFSTWSLQAAPWGSSPLPRKMTQLTLLHQQAYRQSQHVAVALVWDSKKKRHRTEDTGQKNNVLFAYDSFQRLNHSFYNAAECGSELPGLNHPSLKT